MDNDPLAELFSDNSNDNDSFFEHSAIGTAKKKRSSASPMLKQKGKLEDLFGIKEEVEIETPSKPGGPRKQITPLIITQRPSRSSSVNDYFTADGEDDDLGFDPKKPKGVSKVHLFDDFLTSSESKRPSTAGAAVSGGKPTISRQSTDTTTENSTLVYSQAPRPKTSSGRRSSGHSGVANTDPLSLFGSGPPKDKEQNASSSVMSTPKAKKRSTTADWLGLNYDNVEETVKKVQEHPPSPIKSTPSQEQKFKSNLRKLKNSPEHTSPVKEKVIAKTNRDVVEPPSEPTQNVDLPNDTQSIAADDILQLSNLNMEAKSSLTALQQRESQLMVFGHIKKQENLLAVIQRKQERVLQKQQQQFESLLQRQLQRQQEMEDTIQLQQKRISTHIDLMMSQQASLPLDTALDSDEIDRSDRDRSVKKSVDDGRKMVELESDVKRLQLEIVRLEDLVENMKTNHVREIEIIESSYKKQQKVLEEHLVNLETRFNSEVDEMKNFYGRKIDVLEGENQRVKTDHDNELSTLKLEHEEITRKLKRSQEDDLELLKDEHRRMLANIREAKMLEFAAVQENSSYLETLRAASSNLENLSGGLQGLREDMNNKIDVIRLEREKCLEQRERKVTDSERMLKISMETAEEEKRRLMELVSTLELRLSKLSKESAEKNWQLRQKSTALDVERSALERERDYTRQQLERDEQRIAVLKDEQLKETTRIMGEVAEERQKLAHEWKVYEAEKRLNPAADLERRRLELDEAVKIAHEAVMETDAERERLHQLQRSLDQRSREVLNKEHTLQAKEDTINEELGCIKMAEHKSQEMQYRARAAAQKFYAQLRVVQRRMSELGERQARLSEEQMWVAKERLALKNARSKMQQSRCTLCKMNDVGNEIDMMLTGVDIRDNNVGNSSHDSIEASSENAAADATAVAVKAGPRATLDERYSRSYRQQRMQPKLSISKTNMSELEDENVVDQLLNGDIDKSFRKMISSTSLNIDFYNDTVLDDDTKEELALHDLEQSFRNLNYRPRKHICRKHRGRTDDPRLKQPNRQPN